MGHIFSMPYIPFYGVILTVLENRDKVHVMKRGKKE